MRASFNFIRGQLLLPPVKIEHKVALRPRMALDTGAKFTLITPSFASEVGFDLDKVESSMVLVGIGAKVKALELIIPRLYLLGMPVENVKAVCYPLLSTMKIDGILGLNFLQHFNFRIDNDTETMTVDRRRE